MIIAKTIGQDFGNECNRGAVGIVHSVFQRAANIRINSSGRILTITIDEIDNFTANCALVVDGKKKKKKLYVNQRVLFSPDVVFLNGTPFIGGLAKAKIWSRISNDEIMRLSVSSEKQNINDILLFMKSKLSHKSKWLDEFYSKTLNEIEVEHLIGLGEGLTPSGDDFIVGIIHGFHFLEILSSQKLDIFTRFKNRVSYLKNQTGTISRHYIDYALERQWGSNSEGIIKSIIQNDADQLEYYLSNKLAIGGSSGYDESFGIIYAFEHFFDLI
jgi:hypothetical protein